MRTFSKVFALAGARIGYALASRDVAAELNARQAPAPVSTLSVALALAALASPPDVAPVVEERERLAAELRALGYAPLPSRANFLFVPVDEPRARRRRGCSPPAASCACSRTAIRITVRDREDDDLLLAALAARLAAAGAAQPPRARDAETSLRVRLALDGASRVRVSTGAGLYDHFLEQLAFHGGFDLVLEGSGDLETGDHHTAEDAAIALGEALDRALGDRRGIARYGDAVVPMDDALATRRRRPRRPPRIRGSSSSPTPASRRTCSRASRTTHASACTSSPTGDDAHHVAEAAFKAIGRALRAASAPRATCSRRRRA